MTYFAVYDTETGFIENVVECPDFLKDQIHIESRQNFIQIEEQISQLEWIVSDGQLIKLSK